MTLILEIAVGIVLGVILLNFLGLALELLILAWDWFWDLIGWILESIGKAVTGTVRLFRRTAK